VAGDQRHRVAGEVVGHRLRGVTAPRIPVAAGATIGPATTFGYIAALELAAA